MKTNVSEVSVKTNARESVGYVVAKKFLLAISLLGVLSGMSVPAFAVDAPATPAVATTTAAAPATAAAPEAAPAPVPNKGDTTWMMLSTLLVILMIVPGLSLFYGGLVRAKNMLSVLSQVFAIFALVSILWMINAVVIAAKVSWKATKVSSGMTTPAVKVAELVLGVMPFRNSLDKSPITALIPPPSPKASE